MLKCLLKWLLPVVIVFFAVPALAQQTSGGEALGDAATANGNAAEAYYQYQSACMYGKGQPGACRKAGDMQTNGYGMPKDARQGEEYYGYACKAGAADVCGSLGALASKNGDEVKARALFKQGCDLNDALGCLDYARSLTLGLGGLQDREGALIANQKACRLGNADGCKWAAAPDEAGYTDFRAAITALEAGDKADARELLIRACVDGHWPDACGFLLRAAREGTFPELEPVQAREFLRLACSYDAKRALCADYADMLHAGIGGSRDDRAALIVYHDACNTVHDADACYGQALIMREGKVGGPYKIADIGALLLFACKNDQRAACYDVAMMLKTGEGLKEPAYRRASDLFQTECTYSNYKACFEYGNMLAAGQGQAADMDGAKVQWKKACDGGVDAACSALGQAVFRAPTPDEITAMSAEAAFEQGQAAYARQNYALARDLYERGCAQDHAQACFNLGSIYQAGQAGARDYDKALRSYLRGCDLGYGASCGEAGRMTRFGEGTTANDDDGYALYQRACDLGAGSVECMNAREGQLRKAAQ